MRFTHVSRTPIADWRAAIDEILTQPDYQRGVDFIDDFAVRIDVPSTSDSGMRGSF